MRNRNNPVNIKNLYEFDIEYYSEPRRSQEIWWFIIKDASKYINEQIVEEEVDSDDYKYIYIRMFHEFNSLSNKIISDKEYRLKNNFLIWIKELCKEALNFRRNINYKGKTVFIKALKEIPTYNRENFYKITQFIWLLPRAVNEIYILNIDKTGEYPTLSKILDGFFTKQVMGEITFINNRRKEARDNIITSYLPWVKWHVYSYRDQEEYDDILQEANIGLIRAVSKYDLLTLNTFKTYAFWWLKQAINRYIEVNSRTIRLPSNKYIAIEKMKKKYYWFINNNFREPSLEELANICDETIENIQEQIKYIKKPLSLGEIKECEINLMKKKNNTNERKFPLCSCCRKKIKSEMFAGDKIILDRDIPICLDPSVTGFNRPHSISFSILDKVFFSKTYEGMINNVNQKMIKYVLQDAFKWMKPRYVTLLKLRYGLDNEEEHTLQELGDKFDVTRERIRQIESAAIRKLHNPVNIRKLESLII